MSLYKKSQIILFAVILVFAFKTKTTQAYFYGFNSDPSIVSANGSQNGYRYDTTGIKSSNGFVWQMFAISTTTWNRGSRIGPAGSTIDSAGFFVNGISTPGSPPYLQANATFELYIFPSSVCNIGGSGDTVRQCIIDSGSIQAFHTFTINGNDVDEVEQVVDLTTHFINLYPENGTTTATTSAVGAQLHANGDDFSDSVYGRLHIHAWQDSAFACLQSGAVYDAVYTCSGENSPQAPFDLDFGTTSLTQIIAGDYTFTNYVTFPGGGKWNIEYDIQQVSTPWYLFGLVNTYNTIVSTTTQITIGQLSPMDLVRQQISEANEEIASTTRHGIGAILASTTAQWKDSCAVFSSSFNIGDCLVRSFWPGDQALSDDIFIVKNTPPWGYVFRVIDILNATTSTTTMPSINYTFASTSPFYSSIGNIHFDPFGTLAQAGQLVNQMHSDQDDGANVWAIMMPVVRIFMYMVLLMMIVHDLTGVYNHDRRNNKNDHGT